MKRTLRTFLVGSWIGLKNIVRHPLYWFCMLLLPLFIIFFFTDLMKSGIPEEMPVGVVDLDNSAMSRKLIRNLDAYQNTKVVARFSNVREARKAMQQGKIYAFMYFPKGTEEDLLSSRQPKISFYYNASILLAGSLLYKDLRAISTLGSAGVGAAKMSALGLTPQQIQAFLQPIVIDAHPLNNPSLNYNVYLSTTMIPICLSLFIVLVTAHCIGVEMKFGEAQKWLERSDNSIVMALATKFVSHTIIFTLVMWFSMYWMFGHLGFPHLCSTGFLMLEGLLVVLASQGFGIFVFGIFPSLRMSMSICALWAVLSFSISGFTFPVDYMDAPLRMLSWMFPMRHHFMIYQINILNGFSLYYSWSHVMALIIYTLLPLAVLMRIKHVLNKYVYLP